MPVIQDPCFPIDAARIKDPWVAYYLKRLARHLNINVNQFFKQRDIFNTAYFSTTERSQARTNLPLLTGAIVPDDDDNVLLPGDLNVPGIIHADEGITTDDYVTIDGPLTVYGETTGIYWLARVNDGGAHADEWYNVTEVSPTAAGGWVDVVGGTLGTVAAKNLAEEAAGTHDLADHSAAAPNVVIVFMKEDENGDPVHCFRRSIAAAGVVSAWTAMAGQTYGVTVPAPITAGVISQRTGGNHYERRFYYAFEVDGANQAVVQATGITLSVAIQDTAELRQTTGVDGKSFFATLYMAYITGTFNILVPVNLGAEPATVGEIPIAIITCDGLCGANSVYYECTPTIPGTGTAVFNGTRPANCYGLRLRADVWVPDASDYYYGRWYTAGPPQEEPDLHWCETA